MLHARCDECVRARTQALRWRVVRRRLLDICIAMAPLRLPPYVLLEIVDMLPAVYEGADENESLLHVVSHLKKIRLIEGVQRSQRKIDEQREGKKPRRNMK